MIISNTGLQLIRDFEGCELVAYRCPKGVLTIGVGHTGSDVYSGMKISESRALELLDVDVDKFEKVVNDNVKVTMTQGQFDSLVSLAFNIGGNAFKESTLLQKLNKKDYTGASDQFAVWNKISKIVDGKKVYTVLDGLVRRRKAEKELFVYDMYNGSKASAPILSSVSAPSTSGDWKLQKGTFTLGKNINLRQSASPSGKLIGTLKKGDKVSYIAYKVDKNGYVWIKQKRSSGYGYLATGESKNGKRLDYWGKFS